MSNDQVIRRAFDWILIFAFLGFISIPLIDTQFRLGIDQTENTEKRELSIMPVFSMDRSSSFRHDTSLISTTIFLFATG